MNRKTIFLKAVTAVSIAFISSIFLGCKDIRLEDSTKTAAPIVKASKKGIILSIPQNTTGTKSISIYRYDVTDEDEEPEYFKLAILFPKNYIINSTQKGNSFLYEDLYVLKDHSYKYCVKYYETNTSIISNTSEKIKAPSDCDYDDNTNFSYDTLSSQYSYDKTNESIKLTATIKIPTGSPLKDFNPMLAVSNGSEISLFALPDLKAAGEVYLTNLFTDAYLNTPVQILGIVGQKPEYAPAEKEEDENKKIQNYTWSVLSKIDIYSVEDAEVIEDSTITVETQTGTESFGYPDL